jgi:hypothetical protein
LSMKDFPELASVFVASAAFWGFIYFISHFYMHNVKKDCKNFHIQSEGEKALYLSRIPAMLHALTASVLAFIVIFYTWYIL